MNQWIKQTDCQDKGSLQIGITLQRSRKQYRKYHQSQQYHHYRSPYLSLIRPNIKNGLSPIKVGQPSGPIPPHKSLMIKNMLLSPLSQKQHLPKIVNAPQKSKDNLANNDSDLSNKHAQQGRIKHGWKERQKKRFRIKQSYRMKTEQISINLLQKQQRQELRREKIMKNQANSHEQLSRQISKSFAFSDLQLSQQSLRLKKSRHREAEMQEYLLFQNQSKFLKINKLSPQSPEEKLYFTQNAKDQHQFIGTSQRLQGKKRSIIRK